MPEIGQSISHYRIIEKLGQGGMGVVYRAHDTTLDRQVAIKVLPEMFSGDPERLARFEREAKLLASLNHPNIAAIYGLEQAEGKRFLVLELVEGETLAQRIAKGPLPVDEALDVCRQITEGLEAAHERGIIHRDLKPPNAKVTPEGSVKILDFGLAKAIQGETPAIDASESPTLPAQMTHAGVILGTAAYMSPEQAKGRPVDKRTDVWAFGCILFECLTGKRAFEGETITETLAAILKGEPNWGVLPASAPWALTELLRGCLRKDPKERLHDVGDVRILMQKVSEQAPAADVAAVSKAMKRMRRISMAFGLIALIAMAVAAIVWMATRQPQIEGGVTRFQVDLAPAQQLGGGWDYEKDYGFNRPSRTAFVLTPDGRKLVFYGLNYAGKTQLYVRKLEESTPIPIPETEGARSPFLSPDGNQVAFFADGKIRKVRLDGGQPSPICEESGLSFGASWGSSGLIVYALNDGLWQVSESGGKPVPLLKSDIERGEFGFRLPHFLPGGKVVLFSTAISSDRWANARVDALSLPSKERKIILEEGADARYINTGHLVYANRGILFAASFNAGLLTVSGEPVVVMEDVMQSVNAAGSNLQSFAAQFSISGSGSMGYVSGGAYPDLTTSLVTVDRTGRIQTLSGDARPYFAPKLSPNGRKLVYQTNGREKNICIYDIYRNSSQNLTSGGVNLNPA